MISISIGILVIEGAHLLDLTVGDVWACRFRYIFNFFSSFCFYGWSVTFPRYWATHIVLSKKFHKYSLKCRKYFGNVSYFFIKSILSKYTSVVFRWFYDSLVTIFICMTRKNKKNSFAYLQFII